MVDWAHRAEPNLRITVRSKQQALVARLAEMAGTSTSSREGGVVDAIARRGCIEHCPEQHIHHETKMPTIFIWEINGVGAAIVLYNIVDIMVTDRDLLVGFMERTLDMAPAPGARGAAMVLKTTLRLRALGWAIPEKLSGYLQTQGDEGGEDDQPATPDT